MQPGELILETNRLTKRFGRVLANDAISLQVKKGEIHCLLGENGAGKTTLAECLYGYYRPESGEIRLSGKRVSIESPNDAIRLGIGMVHQHFVLVRPLTVLENIVVGTEAAGPILDMRPARDRLESLCGEYGLNLDLSAKIWQLSVGQQQWVEILKALFVGVDLLILDEPTAVLTPQEADNLFDILNKMKAEGLSIIFITHKLREVVQVSDRVTVLRKGRKVATVRTADVTRAALAEMMVGREVMFRVEKGEHDVGPAKLEVKGLRVLDDRGQEALKDLSFQVHQSEIVGIAGVSGNGQRELFEAIIGVRRPFQGSISLEGQEISGRKPRQIAELGIAHIPEDRLSEGLIADFSVAENLILGLHRERFFRGGLFLNPRAVEHFSRDCIQEFGIVTPDTEQRTSNLSGGNLQRVILARELATNPKCLVANQPTRGLDVGAIEYVHRRLLEQQAEGVGVLLFSEDLDEILSLADRILVFFKGAVVGELDAKTATREQIGLLMAGVQDGGE
jgi:simple sugar transport system ATP-binding protein